MVNNPTAAQDKMVEGELQLVPDYDYETVLNGIAETDYMESPPFSRAVSSGSMTGNLGLSPRGEPQMPNTQTERNERGRSNLSTALEEDNRPPRAVSEERTTHADRSPVSSPIERPINGERSPVDLQKMEDTSQASEVVRHEQSEQNEQNGTSDGTGKVVVHSRRFLDRGAMSHGDLNTVRNGRRSSVQEMAEDVEMLSPKIPGGSARWRVHLGEKHAMEVDQAMSKYSSHLVTSAPSLNDPSVTPTHPAILSPNSRSNSQSTNATSRSNSQKSILKSGGDNTHSSDPFEGSVAHSRPSSVTGSIDPKRTGRAVSDRSWATSDDDPHGYVECDCCCGCTMTLMFRRTRKVAPVFEESYPPTKQNSMEDASVVMRGGRRASYSNESYLQNSVVSDGANSSRAGKAQSALQQVKSAQLLSFLKSVAEPLRRAASSKASKQGSPRKKGRPPELEAIDIEYRRVMLNSGTASQRELMGMDFPDSRTSVNSSRDRSPRRNVSSPRRDPRMSSPRRSISSPRSQPRRSISLASVDEMLPITAPRRGSTKGLLDKYSELLAKGDEYMDRNSNGISTGMFSPISGSRRGSIGVDLAGSPVRSPRRRRSMIGVPEVVDSRRPSAERPSSEMSTETGEFASNTSAASMQSDRFKVLLKPIHSPVDGSEDQG